MNSNNGTRVIFMGTPVFATGALEALHAYGFNIVSAYTREPSRQGRGKTLQKSAVHLTAEKLHIPVQTPKSLKSANEVGRLSALRPDIIIVVAYGQILPKEVLDLPKYGCVNVHASLLPRWRGAAPINRALMAGDKDTGVDIMLMDEGLDTGDILLSRRVPILPAENAGSLHDTLRTLGAEILPYTIDAWVSGKLTPIRQATTGAIYAKKLNASDREIDWNTSAANIHYQIMGLAPRPGAWFSFTPKGKDKAIRVTVLESEIVDPDAAISGMSNKSTAEQIIVRCGDGLVALKTLKPAGSTLLTAREFRSGYLSDTSSNAPVSFL